MPKSLVALVVLILALTSASCTALPEYTVRVEADPDVLWWGYLSVGRDLGRGEQLGTQRIDGLDISNTSFWELTLEHDHTASVPPATGRITTISLRVFKTGGEGCVRISITRDGEVVAQAETFETGGAAYCEFEGD